MHFVFFVSIISTQNIFMQSLIFSIFRRRLILWVLFTGVGRIDWHEKSFNTLMKKIMERVAFINANFSLLQQHVYLKQCFIVLSIWISLGGEHRFSNPQWKILGYHQLVHSILVFCTECVHACIMALVHNRTHTIWQIHY